MRDRLAVAVLLGLACAIALLGVARGCGARDRRATDVAWRGAGERPVQRSMRADGDAAERAPLTLSASDAEPEGPPTIEASLADGVRLRVTRAFDGAPIAHAVVDFREAEGDDWNDSFGVMSDASGTWRRFRAGADGRVTVPPVDEAYASHESDAGFGWLQIDVGEAEGERALRVFPESSVTVRVVDAAGRPEPNVGVLLRAYEAAWDDSTKLQVTSTDADGRATFRHLQAEARWNLDQGDRFRVQLSGLFADGPRVDFVPSDLPLNPEPVLVRPPRSTLVARIVDDDGELVREPALVSAWGVEDLRWLSVPAIDGVARLDDVGLDVELEVEVERDGHRPSSARVKSASVAGGVVGLDLPLGSPEPMLVARLVGPDGASLNAQPLWFTALGNGKGDWIRGRTDSDGLIRVERHDDWWDAEHPVALLVTRHVAGQESFALLTLEPSRSRTALDLGEVRLAPMTRVVSGRVVDARGFPIASATVRLRELDDAFFADRVTGADGTFEVVAPRIDGLRLRASAAHPLYGSSDGIDVVPGTEGLVLSLPDKGRIAGHVLVGEPWMLRHVEIGFVDAERRELVTTTTPDQDGGFRSIGLPPGVYTVIARPEAEADAHTNGAVAIRDVEVRAGVVARDPRMAPIDLRGRLHPIELLIHDARDMPLDEIRAAFTRPATSPGLGVEGELGWTRQGRLRGGVVRLLSSSPSIDVVVLADGIRARRAKGARDGDVLRIKGARIELRLHVDGIEALYTLQDHFADVRIVCTGGAPPLDALGPREFQSGRDGDVWTLALPEPGDFVLRFEYRTDAGSAEPDLAFHLPFVAPDSVEPRDVFLALPPDVLDLAATLAFPGDEPPR